MTLKFLPNALQNFSKNVPKQFSKMTGLGRAKSRPSSGSPGSAHSTARTDNSPLATSYAVESPTGRAGHEHHERRDEYDKGQGFSSRSQPDVRGSARGSADTKTLLGLRPSPTPARATRTTGVPAHLNPSRNVREAYGQHVSEHKRDHYDPLSFDDFKEQFHRQNAPAAKRPPPTRPPPTLQQLADAREIYKMGEPPFPRDRWLQACIEADNDHYDAPGFRDFIRSDPEYQASLRRYNEAAELVRAENQAGVWNTPAKAAPSRQEVADAKEIIARGPPGDVDYEYDKTVQRQEQVWTRVAFLDHYLDFFDSPCVIVENKTRNLG